MVDVKAGIVYSYTGTLLVGLISDTHIARPDEKLPPQIKTVFSEVDLILHAGDIWIPSVLDELETIAPVMAAWGDDDMEADMGGDSRMVKESTLSLEGTTVWLVHQKPAYGLIVPREKRHSFRHIAETIPEPPGAVVYGHTHTAQIENYKGVLLVNPGSATWPNYLPGLGTVALLSIDSGEVSARIMALE
jgi:putative phosphoesterase